MFGLRRRGDRGLSESVQWALLAPLIILLIIGIIQAGVILHARDGARAAAMAGAEAQALAGSASNAGFDVTTRLAAAADLEDVIVTVSKSANTIAVTLIARAPLFLDFGQGRITAHATAPLEQP